MSNTFSNLKACFSLLANSFSGFKEAIRRERYRKDALSNGVIIHKRARIHGAWAIVIDEGTQVHENATLTTTNPTVGHDDHLYSKKQGTIQIGKRCRILPGAFLASYCGSIELGDDITVNPYCVLYGHGGLKIGDKTRIAAHTVIVPANHVFADPNQSLTGQGLTREGITIGSDVWIGAGCRIVDGVQIGDGCVVGAGSVVTKNLPAFSIAVGVPARVVGQRGGQHITQDLEPETTPPGSNAIGDEQLFEQRGAVND